MQKGLIAFITLITIAISFSTSITRAVEKPRLYLVEVGKIPVPTTVANRSRATLDFVFLLKAKGNRIETVIGMAAFPHENQDSSDYFDEEFVAGPKDFKVSLDEFGSEIRLTALKGALLKLTNRQKVKDLVLKFNFTDLLDAPSSYGIKVVSGFGPFPPEMQKRSYDNVTIHPIVDNAIITQRNFERMLEVIFSDGKERGYDNDKPSALYEALLPNAPNSIRCKRILKRRRRYGGSFTQPPQRQRPFFIGRDE